MIPLFVNNNLQVTQTYYPNIRNILLGYMAFTRRKYFVYNCNISTFIRNLHDERSKKTS